MREDVREGGCEGGRREGGRHGGREAWREETNTQVCTLDSESVQSRLLLLLYLYLLVSYCICILMFTNFPSLISVSARQPETAVHGELFVGSWHDHACTHYIGASDHKLEPDLRKECIWKYHEM